MKRTILVFVALVMLSLNICAETAAKGENSHFDVRAGWSVGGTMPTGMPETIRSLDSYTLKANIQVGADYEYRFCKKWGVEAGLNIENKSMKTDATVKAYKMSMVKGDEKIEGVFTGSVMTEAGFWQMAIPLRATFWARRNVKVKLGPYVAFAFCTADGFSGVAYNGYLREGKPTGSRIDIGSTEEDWGEYDFGTDLRSVNWGLNLGADWYLGKRLGVYADLTWGMNGAFHSDFRTIEQTMHHVYGTLGVVYRIK